MGVNKDWGLFDEIKKLYKVPECKVFHYHNPANDAHTIGFEMHVMLQIGSGIITHWVIKIWFINTKG